MSGPVSGPVSDAAWRAEGALLVNVAARAPLTEAEGPGRRYALWVQGCPLRCPGCCNPHMLEFKEVELCSVEALAAEVCAAPGVEGLTVVGGEPFAQARALAPLAERVRAAGRSVLVFTGFTYERLVSGGDPHHARLLAACDLLVDGPFVAQRLDRGRRWVGSSNQRVRFLSERYAHLRAEEGAWEEGPNTIELRLRGGELTVNGFPHDSITDLLAALAASSVRAPAPPPSPSPPSPSRGEEPT